MSGAILGEELPETRSNFSLPNGGFLAFAGNFYGRIKSKGLGQPSSFLVRL